jgi:glycosyltransferase involved in cell wall biosynthesis
LNPKISVIAPTKNRNNYLSLAIRSVLSQTYPDFEVILIDASGDAAEIVRRFNDNRIRYIFSENDRGVSAARNIGIRLAQGEYIAFLDDDDVWLPSKLQKQLEFIEKNPAVALVYCGIWIINSFGKTIGFILPYKGQVYPEILKWNCIGGCSRVLIRKSNLNEIGLFDEDLTVGEDQDLWLRMSKHYSFGYLNELLSEYRVHKNRLSTDSKKSLEAAKLMYKKNLKELDCIPNGFKINALWHYKLGVLYCDSGDTKNAKREFKAAIRSDPTCLRYFGGLLSSLLGSTAFSVVHKFINYYLLYRESIGA